jgi:hypothetical protein
MRVSKPARTAEQTIDLSDLDKVHQFLRDAAVVEGPPEFYAMVAELWPDLLHKVKPPKVRMH